MSKAQYADALKRHGFVAEGFMGYYRMPIDGHHWCVSVLNAGLKATRRQKLAYLLREKDRCLAEVERKAEVAQ